MLNNCLLQCFSCCLKKKKTRKEIRQEWKEQERLLNPDPLNKPGDADKKVDNAPSILATALNMNEPNPQSIIRLQSVVRGFLGRTKALRRWLELMEEANQYWMYLQWLKDEEERIRLLKEQARKEFVWQYTTDVIDTATLFLNQLSEASSTVQRIWRGYRARKNLPVRPPKKPRIVKVPKRHRFSGATLRRVWARKQFEPSSSGYLHTTDFGYLEYDMWEHQEQPPSQYEIGLKNRKVKLPIRSEASEVVLLHDRHAWVGLPIGFETTQEKNAWALAKRPNNVKNMIHHSPYKQPLLSDQERAEYYSPKKSATKSIKSPTYEISDMQDLRQLDLMKSLGYNENDEKVFRLPGMPRIGTKEYDTRTGHLLVYLGQGKWKRILTDEVVNYGRRYQDVQENLPLQELSSIANPSSSVMAPPEITEERSGVIHVKNPHLQKSSSAFLASHQSQFQQQFQTGGATSPLDFYASTTAKGGGGSGSPVLTAKQITDSFLTHVEDLEHQEDATNEYERHLELIDPLIAKPLDYNPKTGTPFRGTQKIPYLSLQLKAQQQLAEEARTGQTKRKKSKPVLSAAEAKAKTWHHTKASADHLHNTVILSHPTLSKELLDLLYSDQINNDSLVQTLLSERRELLQSHATQYRLPPPQTSNTTSTRQSQAEEEEAEAEAQWLQTLSEAKQDHEEDDIDSLMSVWKRAVTKRSQEYYQTHYLMGGKISNSAPRRKIPLHYHLKYTWIPQPLVHNAVHEVFYDRSYRDIRRETQKLYAEESLSKRQQQKQLQETMITIVSPPRPERDTNPYLTAVETDDLQSEMDQSRISSLRSIASSESMEGSYYDPETQSVVMRPQQKKKKKTSPKRNANTRQSSGKLLSTVIAEDENEEDNVSFMGSFGSASEEDEERRTREGGGGSPGGLREMPSTMTTGTNALSIRHTMSTNSIPFPKFMRTHRKHPKELTKSRYLLESSTDMVQYGKEQKHRKFQYRPLIGGRKDAKINPMHPYDWH